MVAPIISMPNNVKHSGVSGIPTQLLVLHSGECPLQGGYAQSLTNWANTSAVEASWHWFVDPIAIVSMVNPLYAAWHASEANPMSEGFEQAGYARYTTAEWTTSAGLVQLDNLAWLMAKRAVYNGIPARWLTTDQVTAITSGRDRVTKGFCLHRQIDPETRTDPGSGYPYDRLLNAVKAYMSGTTQEAEMASDEYLKALAYSGWTDSAGKTHPGFMWVIEENQRRIGLARNEIAALADKMASNHAALAAQLKTISDALGRGLTAEQITPLVTGAVREGLTDGTVTVEYKIPGTA